MRKLVALAMTLGVLAGTAITASAESTFQDSKYHWASRAIQNLADNQIIAGKTAENFKPNTFITREEFTQMVSKTLAVTDATTTDLLVGEPGKESAPTDRLSRLEALVALGKVAPGEAPADPSAVLARFYDGRQIPEWAQPAVAKSITSGVYRYKKTLNPSQSVTRGEVAIMLDELLYRNKLASDKNQIKVYHKWDTGASKAPETTGQAAPSEHGHE